MAAAHSEIKATNIHFHPGTVTREERSRLTKNQGAIVWLTGLSACGKSTIAVALEQVLIQQGHVAYVLDGDNIRFGLNKNLGFSPEDRTENIRRIGEVAKLFADSGAIAIASFISPYKADRDNVRTLAAGEKPVKPVHFIEIFVDAPLEVCEKRDPKGLYKKARAALAEGKPMQFTGVDAPYEAPTSPELVIKSAEVSVEQAVAQILGLLQQKNALLG